MDQRLLEVLKRGNIGDLRDLINSEPLILSHAALLADGETPLHIACLARHSSMVSELLKSRRDFAQQLNRDGLSPLHIAAANGDVEIVKELLKVDQGLCLVEGRERRIPLHYAALNGRIQVMKDLILANVDSIEIVTSRGETAFHLAVKYNQFKALRVLLEHAKQFDRLNVLNKKDELGNTILHLAAAKRQHEVIDLLLGQNSDNIASIEVNSLNKMNYTALDVLQILESQAGDREIEDIIRRSGGAKAMDINKSSSPALFANDDHIQNTINNPFEPFTSEKQSRPRSRSLLDLFKYNEAKDSPSNVRDVLLVVSALIASATFQAGLTIPDLIGKLIDEGLSDKDSLWYIKASIHLAAFMVFWLFNSLGLFTSLHMIDILTRRFPLKLELVVSMVALVIAHIASLIVQLPFAPAPFYAIFYSVFVILPFLIVIAIMLQRRFIDKKEKRRNGPLKKKHISV